MSARWKTHEETMAGFIAKMKEMMKRCRAEGIPQVIRLPTGELIDLSRPEGFTALSEKMTAYYREEEAKCRAAGGKPLEDWRCFWCIV